jgi:Cu-Zn family superoxide dismutase
MSRTFILLASALALSACSTLSTISPAPRAVAELQSTAGNTAKGSVSFTQNGDNKVIISGVVSGLLANAEHGFHVHDNGNCSSGDGMSAGQHFNPGKQHHGHHPGVGHHAGDLPNLKADANGVAKFSFEAEDLSIGSGPNDIVERGLIVHRYPDDYVTQPMGSAGPRIACAVIVRR